MEEIVKTVEPLAEWQTKNIHRFVLKGIDDVYASEAAVTGKDRLLHQALITDHLVGAICKSKRNRALILALFVLLFY